jgi:hypothetical protein
VTPAGQTKELAVPPADEASAVYVYGIVRPDVATESRLVGLDDREIAFVRHEDLAAAVAPIATDRPLGRRADLVAHSKVLDALAAQGAVIPVRFGSVMSSEAAVVHELLAPNAARFGPILDELAYRSQFNLRARYYEEVVLSEVVAADPEIAELRELTRDQPEDSLYAERVHLGELVSRALDGKRSYEGQVLLDVLTPYAAAYHVREGSGLDHLIEIAFLVDDSQREDFEAAAEEIAEVFSERARLRLLGPVAPYDFVAEE